MRCQSRVDQEGGKPKLISGALIDITQEKEMLLRLEQAGVRRLRQSSQIGIPGEHEPRDPHANERDIGMTELTLETS